MTKKLQIFLIVLLSSLSIISKAQSDRVIKGIVTSTEDGSGLPGVNVVEKGTTNGTATDFDGNYTLVVSEDATIIQFSGVGLTSREVEIGNQSQINLKMGEDVEQMEAVVVTALGITREKASLGYSVQEVDAASLTGAQESNVINSLSGKVAGVQISGGSGSMGGSSRVLIRGASSATGNNSPLYVVDGIPLDNTDFNGEDAGRGAGGYDYGNTASDINPDDVESVNVLKGAAASALYGSRGQNGVIMITTKSGKGKKKGLGVEFNSSVSIDKVNLLPKLQSQYGGSLEKKTINGKEYEVVKYKLDESWGAKYDPSKKVVHWDGLDDPNNPQERAWVAPEKNYEDFFKTGVTFKNSISLSGADETGSFRLGFTNSTGSGYMPNSQMDKNVLSFNGSRNLTDKLSASLTMTYFNQKAMGRPGTGYDGQNPLQQMLQWGQRQVDYGRLENYKNADGSQRTWNRIAWDDPSAKYADNPYWTRFENYQNDERNRLYGSAGVNYKITDELSASAKIYVDTYNFRTQERVAVGSQAQSSYKESVATSQQLNYEFMLNYNKQLNEDFNLSVTAGGNIRDERYKRLESETQGGLIIPKQYTLTNSVQASKVTPYERNKQVQSLFGTASLGWKNMLYLDANLRNDWSSVLPAANRSFHYPSVSLSWIATELPALQQYSWLNLAKIRTSYAQVGNDTDPYRLDNTYYNVDDQGSDFSNNRTLNNPNLKPEDTKEYEVGLELSLFESRLNVDFGYYNKRTFNQIMRAAISPSSGYTHQILNGGEVRNDGIELMLSGDVIRSKDFTWTTTVNYAKNNNLVKSLPEGLETYDLGNAPFRVNVEAREGQPYGVIMGTDFVYDENGNKIVTNGIYASTNDKKVLGTVAPQYNMGITNSFSYKGIDFGFLIDIQKGGSYFSTSHMWGMYSGMLEATAENGIRETGVVLDGVMNIGTKESPKYVQNTTRISGQEYGQSYYSGPDAQNVFDASYVKLKEVTLGYTLPKTAIGPFQSIRISAFGRNLGIWGLANKDIDPENVVTSSGNLQGIEGASLPSTASYGMNLQLKF